MVATVTVFTVLAHVTRRRRDAMHASVASVTVILTMLGAAIRLYAACGIQHVLDDANGLFVCFVCIGGLLECG
jgi:hypothetical protein